jgi:hypothetical protein
MESEQGRTDAPATVADDEAAGSFAARFFANVQREIFRYEAPFLT